jgi:four helix bundle protein
MRTFEDLRAWRACRDVRLFTARFVRTLPREERRRLGDQMPRAARGAAANIAEGYGRFHYQENIQFCRQARGSLYELLEHFLCAADEGLAEAKASAAVRERIDKALALLNGYINYLRDAKAGGGGAREPESVYVSKPSPDSPDD